MQNQRAASSLNLSSNLCEQTIHLIEFLQGVYDKPELQQPSVLRRAVYRYEKYWLPIAADHPYELLAPPLDIEWAWHCHMLCPKLYEKDCNAIVGTTIDHTMLGVRKFHEKQKQSQKYWSAKYGNDQESFTVDYKASDESTTTERYYSQITYDILAAAKRQMDLCYQVSLPHHRDRKYLQTSLLRYKKFLYLKARMPNRFLEPSYDIDLVWHSHQLNPRIYKQDIMRIVCYFLNHGESVDYRTKEDRMIADNLSRETWIYFYNEAMPVFGAMYRGKQPAGILYKISPKEAYRSCTKSTKITFEKVTLSIPHANKRIILSVSSSSDKKGVGNRISMKGEPRLGYGKITWTSVGQLELDTINAKYLFIMLQEQTGLSSVGPKTVIGSKVVDMLPLIEYASNTGFGSRIRIYISLGTKIVLDLFIRFATPKIGKALLMLEQGRYKTTIIPENVKQCLGPVTFERLPLGIDNRGEVATHRLRNHIGNVEFTARIIHSQALMMSVIQVFHDGKMLAIGHLIGSDHLPLPTQVHQDQITLNPLQGERAIILKNNGGDWGIITGRWKGFKPEVARDTHGESKTESPGTLCLKVYKFATGKTTTVELGYHRKDYVCTLDTARIDLMKGVFTIDSSSNEVAENIALAFSVSLLHVLCVPRPNRWKGVQQVIPPVTPRGYRPITSIPSTDMKFITAAGMLQKTPSNDYMHIYKRSHICIMCAGGCPIEFDTQFLTRSSKRRCIKRGYARKVATIGEDIADG